MNIGENIRKMRKDAGLTMKQLGVEIGLSEQAIGNYERGDREPSFEILNKISLALNATIYDFLDESDIVGISKERAEISSHVLPKYGYLISSLTPIEENLDTYDPEKPLYSITKLDTKETKNLTLREYENFIDSIKNFIDFSFMNLKKNK